MMRAPFFSLSFMVRGRGPLFLLFFLAASLFEATAVSARPVAEEPIYTITLSDKRKALVVARVNDTGSGTRTASITTLPEGYGKSDLSFEATVALKQSGYPQSTHVLFGPRANPSIIDLYGERTDHEPDGGESKTVFTVIDPERTETIPYQGTVVTSITAFLSLGRLYNWSRGGEQTLLFFLDYGLLTPRLIPITLKAEKPETISLKDGPIKARRLRYKGDFPHLPLEQRTGVFYIGSHGEVVRCDADVFSPFKASVAAHPMTSSNGYEVKADGPSDQYYRAYDRSGNRREFTVEQGERSDYRFATNKTDAAGVPLSLESPWLGRKLTASFAPNAVIWTLAAPEPTVNPVVGGRIWLLPFWFATEAWEEGEGPFAGMQEKETRKGVYFPLFTGQKYDNPLTITRLADLSVKRSNGDERTIRHYAITTQLNYDLYTDGKRMVYLAGSDELRVTRNDYAGFGDKIPLPDPPEAN